MRTAIEFLLDKVKWTKIPPAGVGAEADGALEAKMEVLAQPAPDNPDDYERKYATHEGILDLGQGVKLRVYQLNDGSRIFAQEDVEKFFFPASKQPTESKKEI